MLSAKEKDRIFYGIFVLAVGMVILSAYIGFLFFVNTVYMYGEGIKDYGLFGICMLLIVSVISVIIAYYNKLISLGAVVGILLLTYFPIGLCIISGMELFFLFFLLGYFFPVIGSLLLICSGGLILINEMRKGVASLVISLLLICSHFPQTLLMRTFSFFLLSLPPVIISLIIVAVLLWKSIEKY